MITVNEHEKVEYVSRVSGSVWSYSQQMLAQTNGDVKLAIQKIIDKRFHAKTKDVKKPKFTYEQLMTELKKRETKNKLNEKIKQAEQRIQEDRLKGELSKRVRKMSLNDSETGLKLFSNAHFVELALNTKNPEMRKAYLALLRES